MTPFSALVLFTGAVAAPFDTHPEILLPCKYQRLPGEPHTAFVLRELDRIDAIMKKSFALNEQARERHREREERMQLVIKGAIEKDVKRKLEAEALKVLGGGMADHPKASFTAKPSAEALKFDAEMRALAAKDAVPQEAREADAARVLADIRRVTEELRQRTRALEEAKKREKK